MSGGLRRLRLLVGDRDALGFVPEPDPGMTVTGRLADVELCTLHLRRIFGCEVDPARIRQWARRGVIGRHGRAGRRVLYDLGEVQAAAERLIRTGMLTS